MLPASGAWVPPGDRGDAEGISGGRGQQPASGDSSLWQELGEGRAGGDSGWTCFVSHQVGESVCEVLGGRGRGQSGG